MREDDDPDELERYQLGFGVRDHDDVSTKETLIGCTALILIILAISGLSWMFFQH